MVQDKATGMGGSVAQGKDNVWEEVWHRIRTVGMGGNVAQIQTQVWKGGTE